MATISFRKLATTHHHRVRGFLARGCFGAKYIPNKPVKYGIKAFTMADSKKAYLLNVLPYTGSDALQEASTQYVDLPQPARIVLHVIELYLNKSHHVFTDRYYTSIPLA